MYLLNQTNQLAEQSNIKVITTYQNILIKDLRSVKQLSLLEEKTIQTCWYHTAEKFFYKNIERVIKDNLM